MMTSFLETDKSKINLYRTSVVPQQQIAVQIIVRINIAPTLGNTEQNIQNTIRLEGIDVDDCRGM